MSSRLLFQSHLLAHVVFWNHFFAYTLEQFLSPMGTSIAAHLEGLGYRVGGEGWGQMCALLNGLWATRTHVEGGRGDSTTCHEVVIHQSSKNLRRKEGRDGWTDSWMCRTPSHPLRTHFQCVLLRGTNIPSGLSWIKTLKNEDFGKYLQHTHTHTHTHTRKMIADHVGFVAGVSWPHFEDFLLLRTF